MRNVLTLFSLTVTTGLALTQPSLPLKTYVYTPASPADLSGTWMVDSTKNSTLFPSLRTPQERGMQARVEYRSATAQRAEGDVTLVVWPTAQPGSRVNIYGNLKTGQYWHPGYHCQGNFKLNPKTRRVVEFTALCGKGNDPKTIPLRMTRQ